MNNNSKTYIALILINSMLSGDYDGNIRVYKTLLNGDDKLLQPLFIDLLAKGYVKIVKDHYEVTEIGEQIYDNFNQKYKEFLKVYDVFSFVDHIKMEFAFEKFFDCSTDEEWDRFKSQERFFDFRIPIAILKGIDAKEIVFMSLLKENRFDINTIGWQIDLLSESTWAEIDEICDTAIKIEDVGKEVLETIISKGTIVMFNILKKEFEYNKNRLAELKAQIVDGDIYTDDEEYMEVVTMVEEYDYDLDYYNAYYDPYYSSPIWGVTLFIW